MGFSAEKDQEEKGHFTQSLEAIWGDKRTRIRFPSACLPFCCPENYAHRSTTPAISHFLSLYPFLSPVFILSVPVWFLKLLSNILKKPFCHFSYLSFFVSVKELSWYSGVRVKQKCIIIIRTHPLTFISVFLYPPVHTFVFLLCLCVSCISHIISQPPHPPVCHWQLKIISVRPQHPIVHGRCQVPCCHGNCAVLSGCPVDIYRVEKPTLNLDQVAELSWALCLCQIRAKDHRVLNCIMCQTFQATSGTIKHPQVQKYILSRVLSHLHAHRQLYIVAECAH